MIRLKYKDFIRISLVTVFGVLKKELEVSRPMLVSGKWEW